MKKILTFADSFLPGFRGGGPVTSIANLSNMLNSDFEMLVCTPNHDFGDDEVYSEVVSDKITTYKNHRVIYLSDMSMASIKKVIEDFKPDILYLNSFFSKLTQKVIFLNLRLKKKVVVAPRGELQENALAIKSLKKSIYLHFYKLFKLYEDIYFHSTDEIETKQIKNLFTTEKITQLPNAVFIEKFPPLSKQKDELKIIFISRISRKKNLTYALKVLLDVECEVSFDIYGPKEDMEYWQESSEIIKQLPTNIKVSYKGSLKPDEITKTLRKYHLFFFPTLSENFGHVIVEAMQCGLIPLISDQTPWRGLENVDAGWDINLKNKERFIFAIKETYTLNEEEFTNKSLAIIEYINKKLDMKKLKAGYVDFFMRTMEEK
jgi:glycosyltransferase involved in cell wall biosynthesis